MCPFEATSSLVDDASISSNLPRMYSSDTNYNETSSSSDDIPMYIYIKPQSCLPLSEPNTPSSSSSTTPKKRSLDQQLQLRESPKVVVSICSADEQQASIPSEEIQNMKDMIANLKHDPDSIYKRLCVRYDDDTIRRGNARMEEMMDRVCPVRRVTDPGNEK